jgi:ABC-2 type transport system permease protein
MSAQSNVLHDSFNAQRIAPPTMSPTRPFYWSIRRELWEHRSVYIAPMAVAGIALFGFLLSSVAGIWESALRLNPEQPQAPYDMAAGLMMLTGIVVSVFYCLDAMHSERRDRSILFWKSLPVSDLTSVLAKACIPLVILPLLISAITVAMQWLMLLLSSAIVAMSGQSVATLWTNVAIFRMSGLVIYHILTAHALWPAPIYCWLLLVSAWSRRATLLWAVLPLVAIAGVEQIAFQTQHFASVIVSRLLGATIGPTAPSRSAFPTNPMYHAHAEQFFIRPGLWIGLILAALFIAAAVRLRRYQEPI